MGKNVVKMYKDSGEPRRIWNIEDFKEVIDNNTISRSLEHLNPEGCQSLEIFPEIIGSMKSDGNIFLHLPESIAQLGDLETLYLSNCKRLPQLSEFSKKLHTISADWLMSWGINIPGWFHHQGTSTSVTVNLPKNWYVREYFLGFVVCYSGKLIDMTTHLIPLCDDGMSSITQKLSLSNHSECNPEISFLLIPLFGLWDTSKANWRIPNDYGIYMLCFYGEMKHYGLRLLYKVDPELDTNCSSSKKYSNILGRVVSFFSCKPRNLD
ncbi:hypothetical protein H5410_030132 [Solanum commersonii]|uniref:C-JID domain-containing protein n=1 Tax=Solanum commersonii TaxID=4109 RepID=A0A9J5YEV1_SOLCO|nr:hypothetical protein H5410_030132 [Solanum commersonii]